MIALQRMFLGDDNLARQVSGDDSPAQHVFVCFTLVNLVLGLFSCGRTGLHSRNIHLTLHSCRIYCMLVRSSVHAVMPLPVCKSPRMLAKKRCAQFVCVLPAKEC